MKGFEEVMQEKDSALLVAKEDLATLC